MKNTRSISLIVAIAACLASWLYVTYGDFDPRLAASVSAIVAVTAFFYSGKSPIQFMEGKKPRIVWMPKYRALCKPSPDIINTEDPARAITLLLSGKGFVCERQTPLALHFIRGYAKGDFSVELARVNLTVTLPITEETEMLVEAGWIAAFDTGDLWQLTQEIKSLIENGNE